MKMKKVIEDLNKRVKALEAAMKSSNAAMRGVSDAACRKCILKLLKGRSITAANLEKKVRGKGYGVMKYRRVRAALKRSGKIKCIRETDQWVWELVE